MPNWDWIIKTWTYFPFPSYFAWVQMDVQPRPPACMSTVFFHNFNSKWAQQPLCFLMTELIDSSLIIYPYCRLLPGIIFAMYIDHYIQFSVIWVAWLIKSIYIVYAPHLMTMLQWAHMGVRVPAGMCSAICTRVSSSLGWGWGTGRAGTGPLGTLALPLPLIPKDGVINPVREPWPVGDKERKIKGSID